jgi:hypothetical protein
MYFPREMVLDGEQEDIITTMFLIFLKILQTITNIYIQVCFCATFTKSYGTGKEWMAFVAS